MVNAHRASLAVAVFVMLMVSQACGLEGRTAQRTVTPLHEISTPPASPLATPTLVAQLQTPTVPPTVVTEVSATLVTDAATDAWQTLRPGLDRRRVSLLTDDGGVQERLYILRIDPDFFVFDVGYRPGAPQRLMDWQQETGALIVVNGGYFTAENVATGLVVANGHVSGTSYAGFGGMLAISEVGPAVRSLSHQPYNPNEPLRAGLQSFPILVTPDGQIGYPKEDGLADRRTVIAQDRQGRILLILATTGSLTLHQICRYLAESDMEIAIALNLDGGASTGIQLADPSEGIAPFSDLPIVITVRPKT